MLFKIKNVAGFLILVLGIYFTFISISDSWDHFLTDCPNKDLLSWDANLRFNTVVDLYQDIKSGNLLSPVAHTLTSPTWPTLRSNIALVLFLLSDSGPDTILDVQLSLFFYILLFPALFLVSLSLSRDFFKASIIWFSVSQMILHTRQFTVYALSSMLETQGMLFMLLTSYFIYKVYEQQRNISFLESWDNKGKKAMNMRYWPGLFIFSQLLFHTKYPYGLMLLLAIALYEVLRQKSKIVIFIEIVFSKHYIKKRKLFLICIFFLLSSFVFLLVLSKIFPTDALSDILKSKSLKNLIWIISFLFFIDINIFIYKYRIELKKLFDFAFRQIYLFLLAPISFWLLVHPDRLGSIIGTQQHSQEATRSYFISFFGYIFDRPEPVIIISVIACIGVFLFCYNFFSANSFKKSLRDFINHPLTALTAIVLIQFIILEKLTGNKQLRHIYHLIPVLLLIFALFATRIPKSFQYKKKSFPFLTFALGRAGYLILPLSLLFFLKPFESKINNETNTFDLVKNYSYANQRLLCFTGYNKEIYAPVRELVNKTNVNKNTILFNELHNPLLLDSTRILATEFDLLLRLKGLKNNVAVRNDNSWEFKSWNNFKNAIVILPGCNVKYKSQNFLNRSRDLHTQIKLEYAYHHTKSNLCLKSYSLKNDKDS